MGTHKNRLSEAVLTSTHNLCFEQNKKNINDFLLKKFEFLQLKNLCILHGHVFVMCVFEQDTFTPQST